MNKILGILGVGTWGYKAYIWGCEYLLNYHIEDKLSNIKAKTLVVTASEDIYYSPEFDVYPLKEKIENLEISIFDAHKFVYQYDYSEFVNLFREFLKEFKE